MASVFVRATHLLAAAAVAGAFLLDVDPARLHGWGILAALTGLVLLGFEFRLRPRLHREVCGAATILKLLLLGAIILFPTGAPWFVAYAILVAAVGAHAPKSWRHARLF